MSFWSFMGKLALFDLLFNSSSSSDRKTEYPSYTRHYDYDYDDCDCGCRSTGYSRHDFRDDTSWLDSDLGGSSYHDDWHDCDDNW